MSTLLDSRVRDRMVDAVVILSVLAFSVLQLLLGGGFGDGEFADETASPDALAFALVLLSALVLLWRDQHPRAVLGVTLAASLALAAFSYGVNAPAAPAVALYACAVRPRRGRQWPVLAIAAAGWGALVLIESAVAAYEVPDYALPGLLWAGAWLIGDRRRFLRAHVADQLEQARREHELVVAEERARIARELHDSAGHALNTILIQAGAARVLRDRDRERSAQAVATIEDLARETIEEIDRIVGLLREDREMERAPLPGIDQIPALVERQRAGGLDVRLTIEGQAADRPPPAAVSRAAYRIAQESLTNASRHGTGSAAISIELGVDALGLSVANPIATHLQPRPGGGRGIAGMRERAKLLGGSLHAGRSGSSFELHAQLPYRRALR
jgi:signal transduction histidine kinase